MPLPPMNSPFLLPGMTILLGTREPGEKNFRYETAIIEYVDNDGMWARPPHGKIFHNNVTERLCFHSNYGEAWKIARRIA